MVTSCSMKIYTKTGDTGVSSLYNGQRLPKDSPFFEALGDVDELNSTIGAAREFCPASASYTAEQLEFIQSRLLDVGSVVATPLSGSSEAQLARVRFDASHTPKLEGWIDAMTSELPPLKNFILPSGGHAAALLHMARAICRRAERHVVPLVRDSQADNEVQIFLNRLSDYLFTAARYLAMKEGKAEVIWRKEVTATAAAPATTAASTNGVN